MTFADLQSGAAIFVDANILIYHFTNHAKYGAACTSLVERIELKEIQGFTSSHCLADVAHCVMTIEAAGQLSWPVSGLAARLKKHRAEIPKLGLYQQAAARVAQLGIQVLPLSVALVLDATHVSQQFELLTGDALIVATMRQQGLTTLASEDLDFDRALCLTRYASILTARFGPEQAQPSPGRKSRPAARACQEMNRRLILSPRPRGTPRGSPSPRVHRFPR